MKKSLLLTLIVTLVSPSLFGQDLIIKKNAEEIEAKIAEVTDTHVKYRRFTNQSGPIYNISRSEILKIKYENGEEDVFVIKTLPASEIVTQTAPRVTQQSTLLTAPTSLLTTTGGAASTITKTNADKKVLFGLRAGLAVSNVSSVYYDDNAGWSKYPAFGFTGGFLVDFKVAKWLSIQPELRFTMKGYNDEGDTEVYHIDYPENMRPAFVENKYRLHYLELPVNVVFKIPVAKKHSFNIGVGPYIAYGISGTVKSHFTENGVDIDEEMIDSALKSKLFSGEDKEYSPLDFGINALVGFEFGSGFFVDAGYSVGLKNIYLSEGADYKEKNNVFSFSIGCKF